MKAILVPGNSKKSNKDWIEKLESELKGLFDNSEILYYDHWKTGEEIDFSKELKKLEKISQNEYLIIAKSVGAALVLKGIFEKILKPEKCIFLGLPINWCKYKKIPIEKWLNDYNIPTIFMQKSKDPAISFQDLCKLLEDKQVKNKETIEIEGEDHNYENIEEIVQVIKN